MNGDYSIEIILAIVKDSAIDYSEIVEDSLLKVADEYGDEPFRIASVRKNRKEIEIFARHLTISDILTMWCEDVRPENQNGNGAINWIFDGANGYNPFSVSSDISVVNTAYYVNKNVY